MSMERNKPAPTARDRAETSTGTVARIAMLLRVIAELPREAVLGEIAEKMRLPGSTTHRLLSLLMEEGLVERGPASGSYRAGMELLRIAGLVTSRADVTERADEFMQAVVNACDETCMLSLYVPRTQTTMITKVIYGSHPLRYEAATYVPGPLVWGATGRGILAFLSDEAVDAALAVAENSPGTGKKPPRPEQLKRELAQIRTQGYAISHGQNISGAVGISAPISSSNGVIAALCITIPESRFKPSTEPKLAGVLKQQAARFSTMLGARIS
jgi:DNA-binding IclR family transcriptional regulator